MDLPQLGESWPAAASSSSSSSGSLACTNATGGAVAVVALAVMLGFAISEVADASTAKQPGQSMRHFMSLCVSLCVCVTMDTISIDGCLLTGMIVFLLRDDMYRVYSLRMNNSRCVCFYNRVLCRGGCGVLPDHIRMRVQAEQEPNDIGRWQNSSANPHEGLDAVLVHGVFGWIHLIIVAVRTGNGAVGISNFRAACAAQFKLCNTSREYTHKHTHT